VRKNGAFTTLLAVTSEQVGTDLARLRITPRKSQTLRWPSHLANAALRFFLLGYFDGDGFITRSTNGPYVYRRWGLLGTRKFFEAAMRFLSSQTGVRMRHVRRKGTLNVHGLAINGIDALVVDQWLHAGTSLGLARKRLMQMDQADSAASSSSLK
jgi:hypothetical protein